MSQIWRYFVVPVLTCLTLAAVIPVQAQTASAQLPAAPDADLYTNYYGTPTGVNWIVCGSTEESSGCYDFGNIGPFAAVGAMLEGNPSIDGDVVTRFIYVVDAGDTTVNMYVYKKTDTVTSSFDTTVVTLFKTIKLPLTGGSGVTTYMAANAKYLYIGTSESAQGVEVTKNNLAVTKLGGFSPPTNVSSITSNEYGYVTVTQGTAFTVYGPDGSYVEDGGGTQFMLGTTQAVPAASLLIGDFAEVPHVRVKAKPSSAANSR